MLTTRHGVRPLGAADLDAFLALARRDPVVNVFADYRATHHQPRAALARRRDVGPLRRRRARRRLPRRRQPGAGRRRAPTTPPRSPSGRWPAAAPSRRSSARRRRSAAFWNSVAEQLGPAARGRAGTSRTWRSPAARWSRPTRWSAGRPASDLRRALPGLRGDVHRGGRRLARVRRGSGPLPRAGRPAGQPRAGRSPASTSRAGWSSRRRSPARRRTPPRSRASSCPPDRRGQGLATAGMAAVVQLVRREIAPGRLALRQRLEHRGARRLRAGRLPRDGALRDRDVLSGPAYARAHGSPSQREVPRPRLRRQRHRPPGQARGLPAADAVVGARAPRGHPRQRGRRARLRRRPRRTRHPPRRRLGQRRCCSSASTRATSRWPWTPRRPTTPASRSSPSPGCPLQVPMIRAALRAARG